MAIRRSIAVTLLVVGLSGCADHGPVVQAIDINAIGAVQAEIKRQVGVYMAAAETPPRVKIKGAMVPLSQIDAEHGAFMCGKGEIGFDIASIKAELTTTTDNSTDLKAGLPLPVDIVTLGPSGEAKRDTVDTEVLDYNLWPRPRGSQDPAIYAQPVTDADIEAAPIALALRDLRDALIVSAMKYDLSSGTPRQRDPAPCFTDYNPDKPATDIGNSFKLGLSITNDVTGGISVKVAVLTLGATGDAKSTTGNTLSVAFVQSDVQKLQDLKDAADSACKPPSQSKAPCLEARERLAEAEDGTGVTIMRAIK